MTDYALTTPIAGTTRFRFHEVAYNERQIVATFQLGAGTGESFVSDALVRPFFRRVVETDELAAFLTHVEEQGAPAGEWRESDLADWLNAHGVLQG